MNAKRFCWLWGALAVAALVIVVPVGCGPSQLVDEPAADSAAADEGTTGGAATDEPTTDAATTDAATTDTGGGEDAVAETETVITVPLGLPEVPVPADNPMTAEKVALGKMLYFDTRLSKDGKISCATCHDPTKAWTDREPTSTGIGDQVGGANSPTVINAAYAKSQFWDGRAATLEEQALGPIENPIEMGHTLDAMIPQLNGLDAYKEKFQAVFGTDVTADGIAKAIAAFERTVLSGDSPYDKYMAGDESALTDAQKRGMELFESVGCDSCHKPPLFSNYMFQNAGVGSDKPEPDKGRMSVTGEEKDMGKFRVPALREVANTFPYFHDGSAATLEEAVKLMAEGGVPNPHLSSMLEQVGEEGIDAEQQKDIVEFLKALSGTYPVTEPPELP